MPGVLTVTCQFEILCVCAEAEHRRCVTNYVSFKSKVSAVRQVMLVWSCLVCDNIRVCKDHEKCLNGWLHWICLVAF